ncbi:hypothetical protein J2045_000561 [Peteryoungia aggregata LMG 23059]|uniref:Uncharacterized protein n=1 Tax=Peteryoungia aggregata LMG 23059 TaxID=1368425 RepID=A0ABU0G2J6_9HYPH|nr:hypothetical protein [Peteryoungia aggregata]MDQ0419551.1 hypothetical protein [Peteryoungia aggregata LMG 23059]
MSNFNFSTALRVMRQTAPFLMFRLAIYFSIAAAYVLVTGVGAGVGYGIGGFWDDERRLAASAYGAAGGFGLTAAVLYFLREYVLYTVKAGHIAVMVELLQGREIPGGQGQIAYARAKVTERFGTSNVLFGIDQLVKGVINAVTGLLEGLMSILPIPGLDRLMSVIRAYLRVAVGLLDEVMLAHCFETRTVNPYEASKTALVLYAQNARAMLVNAAWVTLWVWLLSALIFVIMLVPAGLVAWLLPGQMSAMGVVFALLFAWAVKVALIEPFAIACMLQAYFKLTAGQPPDPAWQAKLERASDKFKALGERAYHWASPRRGETAL